MTEGSGLGVDGSPANTDGIRGDAGSAQAPPRHQPLSELMRAFLKIGVISIGGGRHAYFHEAFVVHRRWIRGAEYAEDFALAQLFPGSNFVNVALLCAYRLRGVLAAPMLLLLTLLPGIVLTAALMLVAFESPSPTVDAALAGVRIGATALLMSTLLRMRRDSVHTGLDRLIAIACFMSMALGAPLVATLVILGTISIWWFRPSTGRA